MFDYLIPPFM